MPRGFLLPLALVVLVVFLASPARSDVFQTLGKEYPKPDGSNNNLKHNWGVAPNPYLREESVPNTYLDGVGIMRTTPPARVVSNRIFPFISNNVVSPRGLNQIHTAMAQFIAHDFLMSGAPAKNVGGGETYNIPVPLGDPFFDPFSEGNKTFSFARNPIDNTTGITTPRTFYNLKTPHAEAGQIYGASEERTNALRNKTHPEYLATVTGKNGEIFPIYNTEGIGNGGGNDDKTLFLLGDERANLHPVLLSLHVIFVREHNRVVDQLKNTSEYRDLSSDRLFLEARRRVTAYWQNIMFNEYMPATVGSPLPEYTGYDEDINPEIALSFVSSAFRYGHPELTSSVIRVRDDGIAIVPLLIRDILFKPSSYVDEGIDSVLRGALLSNQQRVRSAFIDDLRNFVFGFPGQGGIDLAATNIQRSRDFGIPLYNDARRFYGLPEVSRYEDVISDPEVVKAIVSIYGKNPDNGETYVIGLAEDHQENSNLGPLFSKIIMDQFQRIRDGDRFFFESPHAGFSPDEIAFIKTQTIADVILRNTGIYEVPCSAFFASPNLDCTKPRIVDNSTGALGNSSNTASFLDGKVIVNWEIDPKKTDEIVITLTAQTSGWVALGFPRRSGTMLDTDAIISTGSGSNVVAQDYNIYGQRRVGCPGVCLDTAQGGSSSIISSSGTDENGVTRVTFRRKLDTGDSKDVAIVDDGAPTDILVAFGSSDTLAYHGGNKAAGTINFFTGASGTASSVLRGPKNRLTVHGVLMVFAWLFIFPLGIFLVKFCKRLLLRWWFRLHMIIQYIGTLIVICALILAVEAVAAKGEKHINNAHAILGIITVSLAIIVPALGQLTSLVWTPTRKYAIFPDWAHYVLGYLAPVFSCVTIFFGIWKHTHHDNEYWWWYFLVGLWIVIVVILYIVFWVILIIYNIVQEKNRKNNVDTEPEDNKEEEHWSSAEDSD